MFHGTYYTGYQTQRQEKEDFPTLENCKCCCFSFFKREKPKQATVATQTASEVIPVRKRTVSVIANPSDSPVVHALMKHT